MSSQLVQMPQGHQLQAFPVIGSPQRGVFTLTVGNCSDILVFLLLITVIFHITLFAPWSHPETIYVCTMVCAWWLFLGGYCQLHDFSIREEIA